MSKQSLVHVRSMMFGRPLLLAPFKFDQIAGAIADRIEVAMPEANGMEDIAAGLSTPLAEHAASANMAVVELERSIFRANGRGIGIVDVPVGNGFIRLGFLSVHGTLVSRGSWIGSSSGMVSYDGLRLAADVLAKEEGVAGIVIDFDTGGGEAAGCHDLAEYLPQLSVPYYSIINNCACSAGYYLAAGAKRIYATQDSLVGSIGAIIVHRDISAANKAAGFNWTIIKSGENKDQFSSLKPLSKEDVQWLQNEINTISQRFFGFVAEQRGLPVQAVENFKASIFKPDAALRNGLIDGVMTARDALFAIAEEISQVSQTANQPALGGPQAGANTPTPQAEAPASTITMSQEQLQAMINQAAAAGAAQAIASTKTTLSETAQQITLACNEMGRPEMAGAMIAEGLTVDQAKVRLFDSMASNFERAGIDTTHGGGGEQASESEEQQALGANMVALHTKHYGGGK